MKINYEVEPKEFEAMCNCVTSIFQIYAQLEQQHADTARMMNVLADKIDRLERDQKIESTLTKATSKSKATSVTVKPIKAVAKAKADDFKEV